MSLFARALAIAALLGAARAAIYNSTPDNALPFTYEGFCTTQIKGYKSKTFVRLPVLLIPALQDEIILEIPDRCADKKMELVGGIVTACDYDKMPLMTLAPMAARRANLVSSGSLRRSGRLRKRAHCFVKLYCI